MYISSMKMSTHDIQYETLRAGTTVIVERMNSGIVCIITLSRDVKVVRETLITNTIYDDRDVTGVVGLYREHTGSLMLFRDEIDPSFMSVSNHQFDVHLYYEYLVGTHQYCIYPVKSPLSEEGYLGTIQMNSSCIERVSYKSIDDLYLYLGSAIIGEDLVMHPH